MAEDLNKYDDIEDEDYEPEIITLSDEEGNDYSFEILDELEEDGNMYVALVPSMENPKELLDCDGELVIMRESEENGEMFYDEIEDEKEFDKISGIFIERLENYYEINE